MADVIERMTDKFMTILHEKRPDMGELESRRDAVKRPEEAMFAAVRELQKAMMEMGNENIGFLMLSPPAGVAAIIELHELRSEVKRGDS